jgi:hypothetical protein
MKTIAQVGFVLLLWTVASSGGTASAVPAEPLTYQNVVAFFHKALQTHPLKVHERCTILYEGEWRNKNTYNYCVVIVENSDQDLQITFYLTDDREMNWLNEFFDSHFFTREQTEHLFRLLYQKKHAQGERVGRFRVDLSHWEPRHAEIIVVSFTPRRFAR